MPSIISFGEALIDFLAEVELKSDTPGRFVQHAGGAPANVAVAAAKLGTPAAFVGMLGQDMFGDFLLHSLNAAGVITDYLLRTDRANTALAFVSLDAHGERQFSFYRPPSADLLFRPEHFQDACFKDAAIFHACSNSLTEPGIAGATLEGMQRAHQAGALVSFDMNLRLNLWTGTADPRPWIWRALQEAELVKLSATELAFLAEPLEGEAGALKELWKGRTRWCWVTQGAGPIRYFTRHSQDRLPVFNVQVVNTTAAGDAFVGGLLSWLVREGVNASNLVALLQDQARMQSALRFASACGALAVTRHGAFRAMPTLAEVQQFLQAHP
ncbi:MAG: carbohydrate kinase [Gammaproteobacteria bacterium]|nr:carbohydrate kinase [Gammaproteobacteria bacterium]MDE2345082.1 carbohydrate kinase [Gammaproteobacteria bacterium]